MQKKTPIELERYKTIKIIRTLTRLKYSLAYEDEINETLPATLDEFDKAVKEGKLPTYRLPELLDVGE